MIKEHDYLVKLILIGSSGVGKSSILTQFAENKFNQTYLTTIGVDFRFKKMVLDGKNIKLQIWDTAGQDRFRTITSAYYKGADGIVMVYDLTHEDSLNDLENYWIPQAYTYCEKGIGVLLLGNKLDCDSKIKKDKVDKILERHPDYEYAEVSAKTGENVDVSLKKFAMKVAQKKIQTVYQSVGRSSPKKPEKIQVENKKNSKQRQNDQCC